LAPNDTYCKSAFLRKIGFLHLQALLLRGKFFKISYRRRTWYPLIFLKNESILIYSYHESVLKMKCFFIKIFCLIFVLISILRAEAIPPIVDEAVGEFTQHGGRTLSQTFGNATSAAVTYTFNAIPDYQSIFSCCAIGLSALACCHTMGWCDRCCKRHKVAPAPVTHIPKDLLAEVKDPKERAFLAEVLHNLKIHSEHRDPKLLGFTPDHKDCYLLGYRYELPSFEVVVRKYFKNGKTDAEIKQIDLAYFKLMAQRPNISIDLKVEKDIIGKGCVYSKGSCKVGSGFDSTVIDNIFQELFPFSAAGDKYETFFKSLSFYLSDDEKTLSALFSSKYQSLDMNSHLILSFSSRISRSFMTLAP
jgi:hypothetical protein